jgi:predicted DNA-binding transcriptional regulator AlpA
MDRFLTIKEVAERACVSTRTIQRQVACGGIPAPIKVTPKKHFWKENEVSAWLSSGCKQPLKERSHVESK